jgi:hypothetical protein
MRTEIPFSLINGKTKSPFIIKYQVLIVVKYKIKTKEKSCFESSI